jgi:hypothetical protein
MSAMANDVEGDYDELAASGEGRMEGTTVGKMMIERSGRSDGAMADDKEVENFHFDAKRDDE